MSQIIPSVSFVAPSGTGKTTLIEGVIRVLVGRGFRICVLKHDAHNLTLDQPGKDTWRFRQAGAFRAVIASDTELGMFSSVQGDLTIGGIIQDHLGDADLVITEGFRRAQIDMIRVHRTDGPDSQDWEMPGTAIAWATDGTAPQNMRILPLNDVDAIADFLQERYLSTGRRLATCSLVLPVGPGVSHVALRGVVARLSSVFKGNVVVVAPHRQVLPELGVPVIEDIRPESGALGALLTGLSYASSPDILFLGERHYEITVDTIQQLLALSSPQADIVTVAHDGFVEPLLALYGFRCLTAIKASLLTGEAKMTSWWGHVRVQRVEESLLRE
jgi:molybdopterin-guanine dinucleotide biosynthesis protein MobB